MYSFSPCVFAVLLLAAGIEVFSPMSSGLNGLDSPAGAVVTADDLEGLFDTALSPLGETSSTSQQAPVRRNSSITNFISPLTRQYQQQRQRMANSGHSHNSSRSNTLSPATPIDMMSSVFWSPPTPVAGGSSVHSRVTGSGGQLNRASPHIPDRIEVYEAESLGSVLCGADLEHPVRCAGEALSLYFEGRKHRTTRASQLGTHMSHRSHTVLTLTVEIRAFGEESKAHPVPAASADEADEADVADEAGEAGAGAFRRVPSMPALHSLLTVGKMRLVELAGSDRLELSGAVGETLAESQQINRSLTALGE